MDDIKLCQKRKRIGNPNLGSEDKQSGHTDGIWQIKYTMSVKKSGKWHMKEGIELPNEEIIRTLRERETYKYQGILEVDSIK